MSGALLWFGLADATGKDPPMSVGGLDRLLKIHAPKERSSGLDPPLRVFEKSLILIEGRPPVVIKIPGFDDRGCGACHQAEKLAAKTRDRLRRAVQSLETLLPQTRPVPLQQYILQTYTDRLLQAGQLAHATFRTIRTFPGTVIIDENIYGGQTHLHELLHLAQPFLGHVNELEAYGLNVLADPRFLLLNYPYFSNVVEAYFEPGLKAILQAWYARPVRQDVLVPREVQWYMVPFDTGSMDRLRQAAARLRPLLAEASRLYREHPYKTAYLSAQTGIRSLVLDIAAARLLDPPPLDLPEEKVRQAFVEYAKQITRDDNTRLGYVIDRKEEASMTLSYTTGPKDPQSRLALYFRYLRSRFVDSAGDVVLPVANPEDFAAYLVKKRKDLETMAAFPGLTPVESQGALDLAATLKKIPAHLK